MLQRAVVFSDAVWVALIGAGGLLATALISALVASRKRLAVIELQLALLSQTVQPLSVAWQAMLVKQLTHYHTPELDALLVKLEAGTLTDEDAVRMGELLEERTRDMGPEMDQSEREAAHMLPLVVRRVALDRQAIKTGQPTLVVAVRVPLTEDRRRQSLLVPDVP